MSLINIGRYSNSNNTFTKETSTNDKFTFLNVLKAIVFSRSFSILIISITLLLLGNESKLQFLIGNSLLFIGLFTIGIPHGAVDHLLETGHWVSRSTPRFIVIYLAYSFAMALFWYISPNLALCLFLFYSAWHFGQSDGEQWGFGSMFSYLWGCTVLFYLLGTHYNETNEILKSISGVSMPFSAPVWLLVPFFFVAFYKRSYSYAITILWLMVSSQLPLMLAFGLYFIGQHSWSNWKNISKTLNMAHHKIWINSMPFHLGAWFILALFLFVWPMLNISSEYNRWGIFFIFIACVSLPHVISVHLFKKNTESI